jgi:hypothetical protein
MSIGTTRNTSSLNLSSSLFGVGSLSGGCMSYIKNADLTIEHVRKLVARLSYEDITGELRGDYVLVVRTPDDEIIAFPTLVAARRLLRWPGQRSWA